LRYFSFRRNLFQGENLMRLHRINRFAASTAAAALLLALATPALNAQAQPQSPAPVVQSGSSSSFQSPLGYPTAPSATKSTPSAKPAMAAKGKKKPVTDIKPLRQFAVGGFAGTTGFGGEAAIRLASFLNLRGGGEYFSYSTTVTENGINVAPKLELGESFITTDWFPFHGGFHISPGVMIHNFDTMNAVVGVPGGQSFSVNGTTLYSCTSSTCGTNLAGPPTFPGTPLGGNVSITFPTTGFRGTIGFSNMIPIHKGKHLTFPVEFGILYFPSSATINMGFTGVVCSDQAQTNCNNTASPTPIACDGDNNKVESPQQCFANSVANEQAKLQKDDFNQSYAHFYPILKWGIAYKF
jgi:hypothetical protein